jgi:SAM-dependent methyltransferase
MRDQLPAYWSMSMAYHQARKELFQTIIADCHLPTDALIVDAGCGDGFFSGLIAEVVGPAVRIVAVDLNLAPLRFCTLPRSVVGVCLTDVERAGLRPGIFDVVWMCRGMHSVLDPQRRVDSAVGLLRPGGRLIVVENELASWPIGPWPADFEDRLRDALERFVQQRGSGGSSRVRYHAPRHLQEWLARAGLQQITVRTYPVDDVVPLGDAVETYWRAWMTWCRDVTGPFLSSADRRALSGAADPQRPEYVVRRPGVTWSDPTTVASGVAP